MNEHQKHGSPAESEGQDEAVAAPDATIPCARVHTPDPGATVELTRPPGGRPAEACSDQTILHDSHAPDQPAAPDATILSGRSHLPNPGAGATVDLVRPTPASTDFRS